MTTVNRVDSQRLLADQTHEVLNQPPELAEYDLYSSDRILGEAVVREGGGWAVERLVALGRELGRLETRADGELANRYQPVLRTHDRFGRRLDLVEYHPAWHRLMGLAVAHQIHCLPWTADQPGGQVARAAQMVLLSQVEAGVACPVSMTFASVPALRREPAVAEEWLPRLFTREYDPSPRPASEKSGVLVGMAMTEKQGGSDVRANTTRALPLEASGDEVELIGHKWFCSAPMCDAFLTLAYLEDGVERRGPTCFLVPRLRPDCEHNGIWIQRLKDKLGNRSNASGEIEFHGSWARRVGEPGRGISTILGMVQHTRLDCIAGSVALMRQALVQAIWHARHRRAFGKLLIDQPLMLSVLADLAIDVEAAVVALLRLAHAYDHGHRDERLAAFARLATPVLKFWICKRTPVLVTEALECLGGSGYVEESVMARLYREAPLSSIWEGSGNVICLDVLRAIGREPEAVPAFFEVAAASGSQEPVVARRLERLRTEIEQGIEADAARRLTESLALALQAALMVEVGHPEAAKGFLANRLEPGHYSYGTLPSEIDARGLVERAALAL